MKIYYGSFGGMVAAFEETIKENWEEVERYRKLDPKSLSTSDFKHLMMKNIMQKIGGSINPKFVRWAIDLEFDI